MRPGRWNLGRAEVEPAGLGGGDLREGGLEGGYFDAAKHDPAANAWGERYSLLEGSWVLQSVSFSPRKTSVVGRRLGAPR